MQPGEKPPAVLAGEESDSSTPPSLFMAQTALVYEQIPQNPHSDKGDSNCHNKYNSMSPSSVLF